MRTVGHWIRFVLLSVAVGWVVHWAWGLVKNEFAALKVDREVGDAESTVTYVLDPDRWTDFAVTGQGHAIRILSTANVPAGTRNPDDAPLIYALHYQLVNRSGEVLEDRVYHQRTRLADLVDARGQAFTPRFYQGIDLLPSRSQRLMINLQGMERPTRLRLRLAEAAPPVTDITVRVYERAGTSLGTSARHFERLTRRQQQLLGATNVYGAELLRDAEKEQLMRSTWEPTGPSGVHGEDYVERRLYVVGEHGGTPPADDVVSPGLYMDAFRRVRIPLPQPAGRVRVRVQPIAATPAPDYDSLTLHWTGNGNAESRSFPVPVHAGEIVWEEELNGGWLEAAATFPAAVSAHRIDAGIEHDITPEQRHQRMYVAAAGAPVAYRVDHFRGETTPFRIDLRREDPQFASAGDARYQLLSDDDQVLEEGALTLDPTASVYDRGTGPFPYPAVSNAARYYFRLSGNVAQFRILSELPVLVGGYTRPLNSKYTIRVPEAYDPYLRHHHDSAAPPAWFPIRPVDSDALNREKRSRLLAVQSKPRQDNTPIAADDYDWIDFFPTGAWLARHVLNPRDPAQIVSNQAQTVVFNRIAAGSPVSVRIVAEANRGSAEPTLIFLRDTATPFNLTVNVDGGPVVSTQLSGTRGELRLPPIATGPHTLRLISTGGVSWFINHTDLTNEPVTRRLAYRLSGSGLRFHYTKQSALEETLSTRVQLPRGATYPARVRITIGLPNHRAAAGPLPDLTLRERVFDISARAGSESVPVLGSEEFADTGHTLFANFGSELPPGEYPVSVTLDTAGEAYVSLYRRRPGSRPEHRLFFDTAGGPK